MFIFYCALGPTLAASMIYMCIFNSTTKSMQSAALFLKMGKWLWNFPQPRFQAVGLARWGVKLKTNEEKLWWRLWKLEWFRTLVLKWTLVHYWNTLVFQDFRVGDEKRQGGKKKNRASTEAETSDNIPKRMNLLSMCHMTMRVTCSAVSLDQLEPKKAHEDFRGDWQLFLFRIQKLTQASSK